MDKIVDIVNELKPEELKDRNMLEVVIEKVSSLPSRFQRSDLSDDLTIKREYGVDFLGGDVIGRAISLLGVPKIGKTSLLSQICREIQESGIEILWFESPLGQTEQNEFFADMSRTVLGRLIGQQAANEFTEKKLSIYDLKEIINSYDDSGNYLVIIDDFNILQNDIIERIDNLIRLITSSPLINSVGFILVSNKALEISLSCMDGEYNSPKWDEDELRQFLEIKNISIPKPEEAYCSLLTIVSGGHPLIALALAQKCTTLTALLDTQKKGFPELHNEELTKEVRQLLFAELLPNSDLLQFVLRLSILVSRHDMSVLEFLSRRIDQPLQTPTKRMLEILKGSFVEGDESTGYQVAFVFRNIAESYISQEQKKVIWDQLSDYLLSPEGNTIDVTKTIEGIHYSLLIPNYEKAFFFALQIIIYAYTKENDEEVIRIILSRLRIIEILNFPPEDTQKLSYTYVLLVMAQTYNKIHEYAEANTLLYRILDNKIENQGEIEGFSLRNLNDLYGFVSLFLILNLSRAKKYDDLLNVVNKVDPKLIFSEELPDGIDVLDVIHYSILKSQPKSFPRKFFADLLDIIDTTEHKKQFSYIIACFQRLAFQLSRHKVDDRNNILEGLELYSDAKIWKLLVDIVNAQVYLELNDYRRCIQEIDSLLNRSNEIITQSNILESRLLAMKADSFYSGEDKDGAEKYYKKSIKLIDNDPDSDLFNYSWCNYRLGLICSDIDIAFDAFSEAAFYYEKQGFEGLVSRCYGELAVIYYQKGNLTKTIEIIESLVETYYFNSVTEYAPAVTIGLALLVRLTYERERKNLPATEETDFPLFERGIFDRVRDFAKPNPALPQALFLISEAYKSLGEIDNQKRVLLRSFENKSRNREEFEARLMSLMRIMEILANDKDVDGITQKVAGFFSDIDQTSEDDFINKAISLIFAQTDNLVTKRLLDIHDYNSLILSIEDEVIRRNDKKNGYIMAEIYQRKAGTNSVTLKEDYDKSLLKKAWEYGHDNKNYGVQLTAGYYVGFEFVKELVTSIKELADIHLSVLEACCLYNGESFERDKEIEKIGFNLYHVWLAIEYRTAKESEYPYIINLKYRAENLRNNNIPEELCCPVMILCLIKVFNMSNIDDYRIALEWAKSRISIRTDSLPREEREYLEEFFA